MILAIITAWLAYKRAKASGRNPWLWAFIGIAVYIGAQILMGVPIAIFLAIGIMLFGWPESAFTDYEIPLNIVGVIGAIFASWLLLKYLDRIPDEEIVETPPPPPPTF